MIRASRKHRLRLLAALALCSFFLSSLTALSQESDQKSKAPEHQNSAQQEQAAGHGATPGAESAKESREEPGEEKSATEHFKESSSVRLIASITGLSLRHAYWLSVLINFGVIAAAVLWISRSKLPGVFRNRTVSIQKAMEEARKASEAANQRLADIEARLAKLDVEIGSMRAAAEKEVAGEEARIQEAAEEDARKIVESAEQEIAAAAKAARRDLKAYAADLAVSLAQRQIRVDSATDEALVRNFADQLGSSETNGGSRKDGRG
ncbi:MAG TPA: ATP synthase F0 subunit B [Terriglobales bacterium]|jgi:F-type H+-transporting ATPase subunit b